MFFHLFTYIYIYFCTGLVRSFIQNYKSELETLWIFKSWWDWKVKPLPNPNQQTWNFKSVQTSKIPQNTNELLNTAFRDIFSINPKETKSAGEERVHEKPAASSENTRPRPKGLSSTSSLCVCGSQNAMRTMQFTEENIGEILRLLAGVLNAGNIEFMTAGGAQVSSKSGQRVSPPFPHLLLLYQVLGLNLFHCPVQITALVICRNA